MNLLPFGKLPAARPRSFVPSVIDLGDWLQIAPLFDKLEQQAAAVDCVAALEDWILNWSELSAVIDEEGSRRNIAMTCHTDNADAERAFLHFVESIEPQLKPRQFALEKIYIRRKHELHESASEKPGTRSSADRYFVFDREVANRVELFRAENVVLETAEAKSGQHYQKLVGAQTVNFRGEEKTLVQMGRFLEEPDRTLRQEAWELVAKRRWQDAGKCEEILDELIKLRTQIAQNAGFENYRDYAFRRMGRFDYTPQDCMNFHNAIESEIMPVVREIQRERRANLKLDSLRPWDLAVDPHNRAPLQPFANVGEMVARTQKIFHHLDAELAAGFQQMQDLKLLDLDNRKGKAPGGYQSTLSEARVPFIFMNAIGLQRDVETILHEAGHAFHAQATRGEDLYAYRSAPIEFCEVASMSMELLGNEFWEEFYPTKNASPSPRPNGETAGVRDVKSATTNLLTPILSSSGGEGENSAVSADANRARKTHLEGIIGFFPWMAIVDAFQHWLYTHPGHSRAERKAAYVKLTERFGGDVDWNGHEDARTYSWHRQLHIFLYPFYYVEYGIAQLGALQVWANSKANKAKALNDYKAALALGGSQPLPELFAAAGCKFQFDAATIRPLIERVKAELKKL